MQVKKNQRFKNHTLRNTIQHENTSIHYLQTKSLKKSAEVYKLYTY